MANLTFNIILDYEIIELKGGHPQIDKYKIIRPIVYLYD